VRLADTFIIFLLVAAAVPVPSLPIRLTVFYMAGSWVIYYSPLLKENK
jgi:hypothetical protein